MHDGGDEPFSPVLEGKIRKAVDAIENELRSALRKHPTGFHSAHEGLGVVEEEWDEFKDEVRANNRPAQLIEMTQVGAMAARYLVDLGGPN